MSEWMKKTKNQKWSIATVIALLGVTMLFVFPHAELFAQSETKEGEAAVSDEIQAIHDFVSAFNAKDVDKIMTFFVDDDPVYHNMPGPPVKGTEGVRNLINMFISSADSLDWEILNIAQTGDTVLAERIDRFVIKGKDVVLPCLGAFDFERGKIAEWRDYFDMATWTRQNKDL